MLTASPHCNGGSCGAEGRAGLLGLQRAPGHRAEWDWSALSPGDLEGLRGIDHWGARGGHIGGGVVPGAPPSPPCLMAFSRRAWESRPCLEGLDCVAWRAFLPAKRSLGQTAARFSLIYPAKLKVQHGGSLQFFTDPKLAARYAKSLPRKSEAVPVGGSAAERESLSDND
ncbi:hypothetical protein NDU88_004343 [Pleurodeles waltl]|uniref:Uncharacterized protein n=1 Tax=Pleurodeles waltl TaxID=8319 RepID=A0AAV7W768_PLEWA|nr:hypothetical protein NDU88_004343 [Pleurodeles waltl]